TGGPLPLVDRHRAVGERPEGAVEGIDGMDAQIEPLVAAPFDGRHARAEALDDPLARAPAQIALALWEHEPGLGGPAQVEPPAMIVDDRGRRGAGSEGDA